MSNPPTALSAPRAASALPASGFTNARMSADSDMHGSVGQVPYRPRPEPNRGSKNESGPSLSLGPPHGSQPYAGKFAAQDEIRARVTPPRNHRARDRRATREAFRTPARESDEFARASR